MAQNLEPAGMGTEPRDTSLGASEEPSPLMVDPTAIKEVDFEVR